MSTNYIKQITDTAGTTHDLMESVDTRIFRATCGTLAATADKVATLEDDTGYSLTTGVKVAVHFTYGNSATNPTLKVTHGSDAAKAIVFPTASNGNALGNGDTFNTWGPHEVVIFVYNGTYWINTGSGLSTYKAYNLSGRITNASNGGLTISGSPTITIGHTNILSNAQTTTAVYPITIDKNGHITGYGTAVTVPAIQIVRW